MCKHVVNVGEGSQEELSEKLYITVYINLLN